MIRTVSLRAACFRALLVLVLFFFCPALFFATPDELRPSVRAVRSPSSGVYYCVFVRSFADSDGDGIGDLRGLTAKLDYLNDGDDLTVTDLGITGIWLMPIFESPSYHGYDVEDYYRINPVYGTMADFDAFMAAAHKRGISVILDLACNHSSNQNPWFVSSQDPASPYRAWYRWASSDDSRFDFNRQIWGHRVWNRVGDSCYAGLFDPAMPDFDLSNPQVRAEFKKIAKFWMDRGVSGFRLDAAGHVFNTAKLLPGATSQESAIDWWSEFTGWCRSLNPEAYTVGEVWESSGVRAAYLKGLGSDFHFDLGTKIIDAIRSGDGGENGLANSLYADYSTYRASNPDYIDAPFLTNHDQNRIAGMLKGDSEKLKLAAALYILAEGVPFMYYGEEIGVMGAKPDEQIRTPMIWDEPGLDKSQTSWIVSKYNKKTIPAAVQSGDEKSLLQFYKRLIRVKTIHPALYEGRMTPFFTGNSRIVSWSMESALEKALVFHNLSASEERFLVPREILPARPSDLIPVFATREGVSVAVDGSMVVPPLCSVVLAESK